LNAQYRCRCVGGWTGINCAISTPKSVLVCEHDKAVLTCPTGSTVSIRGGSAFYGRILPGVCPGPNSRNTRCRSSQVVDTIVRSKCQGQQTCTVPAENGFLGGDPCAGTYKYFSAKYICAPATCPPLTSPPNGRISYSARQNVGSVATLTCVGGCKLAGRRSVTCVQSPSSDEPTWTNQGILGDCTTDFINVVVCENTMASMWCPRGTVISIVDDSVFYGRKLSTLCPGPNSQNTACLGSANSQEIVSNLCQDQPSCSFIAGNALFNDPCLFTFKYFQASYTCEAPYDRMS
jgi:hypothetical protein